MEFPYEKDANKVWPNAKYVVVYGWYTEDDPGNDHPWCAGIYDNFYEALGHAYNHIGMIIDSWSNITNRSIPLPEPMDDDAGWIITFKGRNPEEGMTYDYAMIFLTE